MREAKLKLKGFEEEIIYYMLMQKQHTIFMWEFNLKLGCCPKVTYDSIHICVLTIVESKRTCDWLYACMESCCWWCCCCCWCEWGWIVGMSKSSSPKLGVWNVWNKRIMHVKWNVDFVTHKFRRKQKLISSILLKYYVCRFTWLFFVSKRWWTKRFYF